MIKDELGRDAVILHTKRYRQGGFLGYKSKEVVEVTAAVEDAPPRRRMRLPGGAARRPATAPKAAPLPPSMEPSPLRQQAPRQVLNQYKTAGTEAGVSLARSAEIAARLGEALTEMAFVPMGESVPTLRVPPQAREAVQQQLQPMQVPAVLAPAPSSQPAPMPMQVPAPMQVPPTPVMPAALQPQAMAPAAPAMPQGVPQTPLPAAPEPQEAPPAPPRILKAVPQATAPTPQPPPAAEPAAPPADVAAQIQAAKESGEKIQALEDELAQMRKMLHQVMHQPRKDDENRSLQEALKAQDLNDMVMQDIIRKIPEAMLLAPYDSPEAHKALSEYLHGALKTGTGIGLKDGRPKIVALIGTTGVGKTTTIAKIAAQFVLEKGVSVALITADTYRISAVEQLRTYSDIIGLPLEIVYSPAELKTALRKHRDKKLILIDTAGRSQNNEHQMQELKDFLAEEAAIEKHLVMSATTKERDAEKILEAFSACRPDRLLFTKTDETDSVGVIVNLLFERRLALSYLTNGQSVPDDIEPARPEILAKLLLR